MCGGRTHGEKRWFGRTICLLGYIDPPSEGYSSWLHAIRCLATLRPTPVPENDGKLVNIKGFQRIWFRFCQCQGSRIAATVEGQGKDMASTGHGRGQITRCIDPSDIPFQMSSPPVF